MIKYLEQHSKKFVCIVVLILLMVTCLTTYYGSTDIGDYSDTAKFFAGDYSAKIRSSHSYLFGYIHAPFIGLFDNYFAFKISSLFFLLILIWSMYLISHHDKKVLWLGLLSPIIWYMAPWINPIQLATIFLLWSWHNITIYQRDGEIKNLIYSGVLIGLGWAFWDTILYFGVILGLCFLLDKKVWHGGIYLTAIIIGLLPRLVLDQYLFNFAFFTTIKTFLSGFANLFGGIYEKEYGHSPRTLSILLPFLISIPLVFWTMFSSRFKENKRTMIFLTTSLILLLANPQIRYVLALAPIMILVSTPYLEKRQFRFFLLTSGLISLVFTMPYILQIGGSLNGHLYGTEITGVANQGIGFQNRDIVDQIDKDIMDISEDYPRETLLVGNGPDDYSVLAHFYWGDKVKEFVSIQDYRLFNKNDSVLYKKRFEPYPNILERRQFWVEGGLKKSENDPTDYSSIRFGIGIGEPLEEEGFTVVKKYNVLYLSKRAEIKA